MRQHFILGANLRKHYIEDLKFFPENYNPDWIRVRSTDYNRTIMSAQSQLFGLFPLTNGPEISSNISKNLLLPPYPNLQTKEFIESLGNKALPQRFQPIPIHVKKQKNDYLLQFLYF